MYSLKYRLVWTRNFRSGNMVCINVIALNGTQIWLALIIWFSFDFGWIVQRSLAFYRDVTEMLDLSIYPSFNFN